MKTSKAQAQDNRAHVVQTASALFRERGYDGVSVAELMAAAGFTHGGFYKQFRSKADLMAESVACGMAQTAALAEGMDRPAFVRSYLSRAHRDMRAAGCTMAALGADAARQPKAVRAAFVQGIECLLQALEKELPVPERAGQGAVLTAREARAHAIDTLAHAVGAIAASGLRSGGWRIVQRFIVAQQFDARIQQRMQRHHAFAAQLFVQRQLGGLPGLLCLGLLGNAGLGGADQAAACVRAGTYRQQTQGRQRLEVARQRGGVHLHAPGQISRAYGPELDHMGQQRVLRDLQAHVGDKAVVVARHDAAELAQLEVGAPLGLDGVLHLIYCRYNSCNCKFKQPRRQP